MQKSKYVIRESNVLPYHPANHTGTTNRRLVGPETVGARNIEVLMGVIEPNERALPHAHPGIEQVAYMISGHGRLEIGEGAAREVVEIGPGDTCFLPAGVTHAFAVLGDESVKVLVMYAPPYGEKPENVIRKTSRA